MHLTLHRLVGETSKPNGHSVSHCCPSASGCRPGPWNLPAWPAARPLPLWFAPGPFPGSPAPVLSLSNSALELVGFDQVVIFLHDPFFIFFIKKVSTVPDCKRDKSNRQESTLQIKMLYKWKA